MRRAGRLPASPSGPRRPCSAGHRFQGVVMLVELTVWNFRSIRDELRLTFASTAGPAHRATHCAAGGVPPIARLSKAAFVFGPNGGGGKSTLLGALARMRELVLRSVRPTSLEFAERHQPFDMPGPNRNSAERAARSPQQVAGCDACTAVVPDHGGAIELCAAASVVRVVRAGDGVCRVEHPAERRDGGPVGFGGTVQAAAARLPARRRFRCSRCTRDGEFAETLRHSA